MTRTAHSLALLDASPEAVRDALLTYRALALSALDSLAEATALLQMRERQLAETRAELRRYSAEACR